MVDFNTTAIIISILVTLVLLGVHVGVALGLTSFVGLLLVTGDVRQTADFMSSTAYEALRDYAFATIPLFVLMGEFIARSGAAGDVYGGVQRSLRGIRGRLAHATVIGNAIFSFVTGTSSSAAVAFTKIAYPEMRRHGYDPAFSLGLIAGSACLGPLIPPSVLFVIWAILTDQSAGTLLIAGTLPGLMLTALLMVYITAVAYLRPDMVGDEGRHRPARSLSAAATPRQADADADALLGPSTDRWGRMVSTIGITAVLVVSIGGIWFGWFTATEGAGIGALLGLALAIAKGMSPRALWGAVLGTAQTSIPLMIVLFAAQLYSRTLALSGVGQAIQEFFLESGLGLYGILATMMLIWFLMGMLIDGISIMLLTVPIFAPLAAKLGFDPVAFALIGVLVIEVGLITPPFGINVHAVKAAVSDHKIRMAPIFFAAIPTWLLLLLISLVFVIWPETAMWLPNLF